MMRERGVVALTTDHDDLIETIVKWKLDLE